jgi:hypothetical protein
MSKNVVYINIDSDVNYYDTSEQIRLKNIKWFVDATSKLSVISGSNEATGFFSQKVRKDRVSTGLAYVTSSIELDSSGAQRKILAGTNDFVSSSNFNTHKQGVDIRRERDWTEGLAKISAGNPGHLHFFGRYGATDATLFLEENYYTELDVFDPVDFVQTGGTYYSTGRYPLFIKSDFNQPEKILLDGIIEPLTIRPVISRFSLNTPFEPRSFKGQFGNGNMNWRAAADQILSVDYRTSPSSNESWFIDDYGTVDMGLDSIVNLGNASIIGYINHTETKVPAYVENGDRPRGYPLTSSYGSQLSSALVDLLPGGDTYVADGQVSSTCGFTYDNPVLGTDSISYGGLLY